MAVKITNLRNDSTFYAEAGETVLEAALRTGHVLPYGCQSGSCGECKATLVSGEVRLPGNRQQALTDDDRSVGKTLLCQAVPQTDISLNVEEFSIAKGIEIKTMPSRISAKYELADDVIQLFLTLPKNQSFNFLAGQYINILLPDGKHRSFSIANNKRMADRDGLELHIRIVPGGLYTPAVFTNAKAKDIIRFQGPFGTYFLRDDNRPAILIAGGTGFAPIKSLVEEALDLGVQQDLHIFWGVRAEADLYLGALPQQWSKHLKNVRYTPVLSEPQANSNWQGETGFVHEAVVKTYANVSQHTVYASGPPVMVNAVHDSLKNCGLNTKHFFSDTFDYAAAMENN